MSKKTVVWCVIFLISASLLLSIFTNHRSSVQAQSPVGFGIIGDSGSDEYRADDNRAGSSQYAATTLNWVELLAKKGVNVGPWSTTSRGEPRRRGFEYNYARSAAKLRDAVNTGQHTGMRTLIQQGKVSHVHVEFNGNDYAEWNGSYREIYDGVVSGSALQAKADAIVADYTTILNTLQSAGNVKVQVATFPDLAWDPGIVARFPDATKRQRVTNFINGLNARLVPLVQARGMAVFDTFAVFQTEFAPNIDANGFFHFAGELIDSKTTGDEPHHVIMADKIHAGTVMNGVLANAIMRGFNTAFGTTFPILSDQEVLQYAGIQSTLPTSTPTVSAQPTITLRNGDVNNDGTVNAADIVAVLQAFLQSTTGLLDQFGDGKINSMDFARVFAQRVLTPTSPTGGTATPTPSGGVPEAMSMHTWGHNGSNKPNPTYDRCDDGTDVVAAHNQYYVIAYDGVKYPTWHPPVVNNPITGSGKCYFGHEHGADPQKYMYWNEVVQHFGKDLNNDGTISPLVINVSTGAITPGDRAGIPFGIANEHMDQYYNQEDRDSVFVRHEDHVGHKIEFVNKENDVNADIDGHATASTHEMAQLSGTNGLNVPYYTSGSNTFQPTGVVCTHLHKFHQGTHSGDAILNNLHEVIFHSTCQSVNVNGINAPAYYPGNTVLLTGMMAFGKPGVYKRFCFAQRFQEVCGLTGANYSGSGCTLTDPLLSKLPNAINSSSLGRNMTDKSCLQNWTQINPGNNYFAPYEIWEGDFAVYTGNTLSDSSMIAEHGRQWDVLDPVRFIDVGYQHPTRTWQKNYQFNSENCKKPGGAFDALTFVGGCNSRDTNTAFDSPQSGFRGLKRTTYFGRNRVSNPGGAQTWWTDPLGGNAVTTPFTSGLKQRISSVEANIQAVQSRVQQLFGSNHFLNDRALQRAFSSGGGTVHAPN